MKTVFHVNDFISNIKHLVRDYLQVCSAPFSVRTISFREELFSFVKKGLSKFHNV